MEIGSKVMHKQIGERRTGKNKFVGVVTEIHEVALVRSEDAIDMDTPFGTDVVVMPLYVVEWAWSDMVPMRTTCDASAKKGYQSTELVVL